MTKNGNKHNRFQTFCQQGWSSPKNTHHARTTRTGYPPERTAAEKEWFLGESTYRDLLYDISDVQGNLE